MKFLFYRMLPNTLLLFLAISCGVIKKYSWVQPKLPDVNGLFGNDGQNFQVFDLMTNGMSRNFAGNYFIWMAMEGTKVEFPPQVRRYLGEHQAQMLKGGCRSRNKNDRSSCSKI